VTDEQREQTNRLVYWVIRGRSAQAVTMRSVSALRRACDAEAVRIIRAATVARLRAIRHARIVVAGEAVR
jgi:hypothetical protein